MLLDRAGAHRREPAQVSAKRLLMDRNLVPDPTSMEAQCEQTGQRTPAIQSSAVLLVQAMSGDVDDGLVLVSCLAEAGVPVLAVCQSCIYNSKFRP